MALYLMNAEQEDEIFVIAVDLDVAIEKFRVHGEETYGSREEPESIKLIACSDQVLT